MSKTTGIILTTGAFTWLNQVVLDPRESNFDNTVRIGVATGLLSGVFFGIEKIAPNLAVALAYTALVTTLVVRIGGKPTPLERLLDVVA